jgi:hypothetical protein
MARFDWAGNGDVFDIADLSDEEWKGHFNSLTQEQRNEILDDLHDQTVSAEEKQRAIDLVARAGELLLKIGGQLI